MGKISEADRKTLLASPYVEKITNSHVVFTVKFKTIAIQKYFEGNNPSNIFNDFGIPTILFLPNFPNKCIDRWKTIFLEEGVDGFSEEKRGKGSSGRPHSQKFKSLEEEIAYLREENAFLKKAACLSGRIPKEKRFSLIAKANVKAHSINGLCKIAKVSRSGFYNFKKRSNHISVDEKILIDLFNRKKGKFGIRRLKMELNRKHGKNFNLKKIVRIKKKFGLQTVIRKKSLYRMIFKEGEEHKIAPNFLERNFNPSKSEICLSTDITELHYKNGQKAYLSAVKDLRTKEIVNFELSIRPTVEMVTSSLDNYLKTLPANKRRKTLIHSDQGVHYTSFQYRYLLEKYKITQSMSRKGNCLDNSPIESFFGHLKDEVDYKNCKNFKEVRKKIKTYINYYNEERPQWGLKQKTPAEARVKL